MTVQTLRILHLNRMDPSVPTRFQLVQITVVTLLSPGVAVRLWQLGIQMRPLFSRESLWVYPLFASIGGSFGYWLDGVESRQLKMLESRKAILLEKRKRRAEREAREPGILGLSKTEQGGVLASTS
jgi:hypothetical protein